MSVQISGGRVVSLLELTFREIRSVRLPVSGGRAVNRLFPRWRKVKLVSLPISGGSAVNRFPSPFQMPRSSFTRLVNAPDIPRQFGDLVAAKIQVAQVSQFE